MDRQTGKWSFTSSEAFLLADRGLFPSVHFPLFCPLVALHYSLWQFFHRPTVVPLHLPSLLVTQYFPLKKLKIFPFTPSSVSISDRKCLPFYAMQIPPLDICKLLPHFFFAPLCHFLPVQIYLSVFTQKSVLQAFAF